jgi:hypothetical protein
MSFFTLYENSLPKSQLMTIFICTAKIRTTLGEVFLRELYSYFSYVVQAGSIEGKVVEMGLTRTTLLSIENFFLTVPNSCFLEEVGLPSPLLSSIM